MKKLTLSILLAVMVAAMSPHAALADDVALPCSGDDCGAVRIPDNDESKGVQLPGNDGMPSAGQAGSAPGNPVSGDTTGTPATTDPLAPNEPPSP